MSIKTKRVAPGEPLRGYLERNQKPFLGVVVGRAVAAGVATAAEPSCWSDVEASPTVPTGEAAC